MKVKNDTFHAIADPNRRKLLDLLRNGEKPVGELVESFDMTFPGISQHLKILTEAGLVKKRRMGRFQYYRAHAASLQEVQKWVMQYEPFWKGRLKKLGQYLDEHS